MIIGFDLDDTLYEERDFAISGYRAAALRLNELTDCDVEQCVCVMTEALDSRDNPFDALQATMPDRPLPLPQMLEAYRNHKPDIHLDALVIDTLQTMHLHHTLCLITDGRSLTQRNKIRALGLERYFSADDILISEETGADKRLADNFLAMERRYPNQRYVYVGDNPKKDFFHPNQLGWATVIVNDHGHNIHRQTSVDAAHNAQYRIASIAELPALIDRLAKK